MTDPARILIVDDTLKNIQVLGTLLRQKGYQINVAQNGAQAIETAKKVLPDLILLDIMMPEMDGFEACEILKGIPETVDIPIIFLTAKIETDDIVKGFELGAVDYVTKPFQPTELISRIATHLEVKRNRERLEELRDKLAKYLSPQVFQSIVLGQTDVKIESYRKKLTVFFSDIVDFTPRAESMDHQDLTMWLNNYLNEMSRIAMEFGGTVDKFIGDAVMIFFGDPTTHGEQEDALRCVKMAQAMLAKASELDVKIRIGITTGECTVGNFGSDDRMDYTIIGGEVNAAARLESNSEPGKILIADSTFGHVKDTVTCTPRGEIQVKGIERAIMTYWVS